MEQKANNDLMTEYQLQNWVIKKIEDSVLLRRKLCILLVKHETTIKRYLKSNHNLLSKPYTLDFLAQVLVCDKSSLIEPRK